MIKHVSCSPAASCDLNFGHSRGIRMAPAAVQSSRQHNQLPHKTIQCITIYYHKRRYHLLSDKFRFTKIARASLPYHTLQYMSYQFKYCRDAVVSSIRLDARALYKWPLFINHEFQKTENGCITAITSTSI